MFPPLRMFLSKYCEEGAIFRSDKVRHRSYKAQSKISIFALLDVRGRLSPLGERKNLERCSMPLNEL